MRTTRKMMMFALILFAILGFFGAWLAIDSTVYGSTPSANGQTDPADETPVPAEEATPPANSMSGAGHAGHHPMPSAVVTDTVELTATETITMPAQVGMMSDMTTMHGSMAEMHNSMVGDMRVFLNEHVGNMTPAMAADAGRVAGRLENMGAMMGHMTETMEKCMHGSMMAGMEGMDAEIPFDALFIDSMIVHHEGAIEMATVALEEAEHDELVSMAEEIVAAQEGEIELMQAWRDEWYPDLPASGGMDMAMGDMEIADDSAVPFDQRFLEAMISHHRGAIAMAESALTTAEHEEIVALAEDIIAAQESEIVQMEEWLLEWYDVEVQAASAVMPGGMQTGMMGMMHDMQGDMAAMMEQMPDEMVEHMDEMHAQMDTMMSMMGDMEDGAMDHTMPMTGTMPMGDDMPMMDGAMGTMDSMMEGMQTMMDEMMAGDAEMMTPEMAAEMGRMLGRMQGMSDMMDMMPGGMADCPMMDGMMEGEK